MRESVRSDLDKLFAQYARAFTARDLPAIAGFYSFPVSIYSEDGACISLHEAAFKQNAKRLVAQYDRLGMKSVDFRLASVTALNSSCSIAEIEWRLSSANDTKLVEFVTRYIVGTQNGSSTILGVVMVDEREAISAFVQSDNHDKR